MTRLLAVMLVFALPLAAACLGGDDGERTSPTPASQRTASGTAPRIADEPGLSTVEIARKLAPSIVRVQTEGATLNQLGRVVPGGGVGTGVIIDSDGRIVTNNHVVVIGDGNEAADRITVTLSDQRTFPATIVGRDQATDIAVLDIDAEGLTAAEFGDADALEVGQDVVAIGFALGLEGQPSVTRGVISATNRTIEEEPYTIPDAIQTDSGINPGNSGGPLVNARGEVIGINTAILRNAQNIGFAISVALVEPTVQALIQDGRIQRAYLGIGSVDVTAAIARNFDLPVDHGIAVTVVAADTPAEGAGLRQNDVIVSIDGREVRNNGDLLAVLAQHRPGDTVVVEYFRDADKRSVEVTLDARPGDS